LSEEFRKHNSGEGKIRETESQYGSRNEHRRFRDLFVNVQIQEKIGIQEQMMQYRMSSMRTGGAMKRN
jgi:hypothetical protein